MASNTFMIVSGTHRGAVFTVTDNLLVIGADAGCDICLTDPGLAARHAAVMLQASGVSIRRLDGAVRINGEPLTAPSRASLQDGDEIALGETTLRLQAAAPAEVAKKPKPRRRTSRAMAGAMLVLVAAAGAFLSIQKLNAARRDKAPELQQTLPSAPAALTAVELAEQVQDIFRIHGYDAKVTPLGPASVRIENLDESYGRVQYAATQARTDVPQLKSLSFAHLTDGKPPEQPSLYTYESNDRMSARVEGETAYLASTNGSRYFVGSVLPTGYTVRRITDQAVQVDREGQISWVRF